MDGSLSAISVVSPGAFKIIGALQVPMECVNLEMAILEPGVYQENWEEDVCHAQNERPFPSVAISGLCSSLKLNDEWGARSSGEDHVPSIEAAEHTLGQPVQATRSINRAAESVARQDRDVWEQIGDTGIILHVFASELSAASV